MPLRNRRKKPWCKLGFTTVQEAEESQQCPEITQHRIVGREEFSPCLLEILARQTYLNCRSCHIQFTGIASRQLDPLGNAGQTHLKFGRQNSRRRAPTRGAPTRGTNCLLFSAKKPASSSQRRMEFAIGHKGCPYDLKHSSRRYAPQGVGRAPTRGAPLGRATHKGGAILDSGTLTWFCPNLMQLPCWAVLQGFLEAAKCGTLSRLHRPPRPARFHAIVCQ